jgi:hypothetical protein
MKLTDEEVIKYWQKFRHECNDMLRQGGTSQEVAEEQMPMVDAVLEAFKTIEAQKQEIEKKEGALEADLEEIKRLCKLVQQLQAQVEKAREAMEEFASYYTGKHTILELHRCKICEKLNLNDAPICLDCVAMKISKALSFLEAGDST